MCIYIYIYIYTVMLLGVYIYIYIYICSLEKCKIDQVISNKLLFLVIPKQIYKI